MTTEKVIIIGGGPTGLAGSIYNARADLHPLVIAGSPSGGQLMLTSHVENYPGFESILGPDLIAQMRKHAEKFGARFIDSNISHVDFTQQPLKVFFSDGTTSHAAESILIATGADAVWLNLPSEQRLRGKGVSACATCDGFFFRDKIVGVVGGGDTAMEEALTLTKFASKAYVIHRKDSFRASKIMQKRVFENPKIEIIWNASVEKVIGENKVEGVRLKINSKSESLNPKQIQNPNDQNSKRFENLSFEHSDLVRNSDLEFRILPLDGLFIAIGHKPATDFLKQSRVLLDEKGYVMTSGMYALTQVKSQKLKIKNEAHFDFNYQYATSIRGVFAAGDVIDPYYRQAATAVGMGVAAALEIERYVSL